MNTELKNLYRVLVVDDNPDTVEALKLNLEDLSLVVQTARSAIEALKLDFNQIDCIITDIRMPEMNGVEFIKELESRGIKKVLFFITGYHDFPRNELHVFSPRAVIFKPFDAEEASLLIKNHLMRLS